MTLPKIIVGEFIDLEEKKIDVMKCDVLKSELRSRSLKVSGNKFELVARL